MKLRLLILLVIAGFSTFYIQSQQIVIVGKVTDSLQNPLEYVNILAIPQAKDQEVRFAITGPDGSYTQCHII